MNRSYVMGLSGLALLLGCAVGYYWGKSTIPAVGNEAALLSPDAHHRGETGIPQLIVERRSTGLALFFLKNDQKAGFDIIFSKGCDRLLVTIKRGSGVVEEEAYDVVGSFCAPGEIQHCLDSQGIIGPFPLQLNEGDSVAAKYENRDGMGAIIWGEEKSLKL